MKKVIFSGIQPSGNLHIGNYIGAIQQWLKLQEDQNSELIFCIVDLHAITVKQESKVLREKIKEVVALYLACGIDPKKSRIFIQSENPDHTYLAWIFNVHTQVGELMRMTQYKIKSGHSKLFSRAMSRFAPEQMSISRKDVADLFEQIFEDYSGSEKSNAGLLDYPVLMAADILLYDTDSVPVGDDQLQHIELTRKVAERFNKAHGELFKLPKAVIDKEAARIRSLQDPKAKMSKSDIDPKGTLNLLDEPDDIEKKIKIAITDSNKNIDINRYVNSDFAPDGISNLLTIYARLKGVSFSQALEESKNVEYSRFKEELAKLVILKLKAIQTKYEQIRSNEQELEKVLNEGLAFAREKSSKKITQVKEVIGLGR